MPRTYLILSYFANIDAMAPSHHIDDKLPVFAKKSIEVQLLTSPCGAAYKGLNHTRVPSPAPSGIRYEVRYFLRRKTKKRFWFKFFEAVLLLPVYPLYLVEKIFLRLDSTWSWFLTASFASIMMAIRRKPSVIYSTGGPVSAHLAAMAASIVTRIPYIAEFQDPLVHQYAAPGRFERHFIERVEKMIFRTAKSVVFLTEEAAARAERRHGSGKAFTIYAGAEKKECDETYRKEVVFTIAHFGSLGGSRNLKSVLGALDLLFKESPEAAKEVRLELFGNNSREVKKEIEESGNKELIISKGKVKRETAIARMHTADLLLLIQNTDDVSFETIPSKTYEYMNTGRPVLALVYRNRELKTMLEDMGHVVVEADDPAAAKEGIRRFLELWRKDRLRSSQGESPYTVEKAVERFIALAER